MNPYASPSMVRVWACVGRTEAGEVISFTLRCAARFADKWAFALRDLKPIVSWRLV